MPYIKPEIREALDKKIDTLAIDMQLEATDEADRAGILNYVCTSLALKTMPARRYANIATVTGVFVNVAQEYYRRFAAPYEDEKMAENGDVYYGTSANPPDAGTIHLPASAVKK